MPNAPSLFAAAAGLWILDASLNISMESFRALVGDMLDTNQHTAGYAIQTAFIGAGAVVGSVLPFVLDRLGVANIAPTGHVPNSVRYSFYFGGGALFLSVLWTVLTTREYSPLELAAFGGCDTVGSSPDPAPPVSTAGAAAWIAAGAAAAGLSGGTLERPALQRLLGDVAAGRVDIIVVYKVDRLTRSLFDFARLVEQLEKAGISFVSVTQSFNTTTSMGRLTLNMLLSFAQFEREVTAERVRDKIAASGWVVRRP